LEKEVGGTLEEERLRVLKMIEEGKISAEEGMKLLEAVEPPVRRGATGTQGRWLRVRVLSGRGKQKVNVNLPLSLVDVALRFIPRGARLRWQGQELSFGGEGGAEGLDVRAILDAVKSGGTGKLVEVDDEESGDHVEIYVD